MNDRQKRFIELLEKIFEIDKSDLDFGIYRILNFKRTEITSFFRKKLPKLIEQELRPFANAQNEDAKRRIAEIEAQLGGRETIVRMPQSLPIVAQYHQLTNQLSSGLDMAALESDVYSALFSFFNRYYDEGDFISMRRYKEGVYAVPYQGEEVKLYWANQDQYYIKTSENFRDYTFMAEDITVHFRLVDATTEQNNNKENENEKRVFMLFEENEELYPGIETFSFDDKYNELTIRFVYDIPKDKKRKYSEENYKSITQYIVSEHTALVGKLFKDTSANTKDPKPLIKKHLDSYVAKNTFDYFIHKDLKGFLNRELDFYIKNEILHIDDIDSEDIERNAVFFAKIRAIKKVARIIIDFLAQLENYQKRIWLKKKFVVETNWCITLDNIDESFYPEIASNEAQIEDWVKLFAIDKIEADGHSPAFSHPLTTDFLKVHSNLVLDTRHFSRTFRDRLIASIDNLDDKTNGVMVNSDNYHALRLLQTRYGHAVDAIYIDPPYNSPSSVILYKNSYKHSSWLCMLDTRLSAADVLMTQDAAMVIAIDENEHVPMTQMLNEKYSGFNVTTVSIEHNKKGIQGDNFSFTHEYADFVIPAHRKNLNRKKRNVEDWDWSQFRNWGTESLRSDAANCFYPVYIRENEIIGYGDVVEDDVHPKANEVIYGTFSFYDLNGISQVLESKGEVIAVYPIDSSNIERKWRYAFQTFTSVVSRLKVDGDKLKQILIAKVDDQFKTLWDAPIYNAGDYGTKLLTNMGFSKSQFAFPKSIHTTEDCVFAISDADHTVLDYFAGSGTTGHAVISLNRKYKTDRRYILVEMGTYFDTVTLPRIIKAIYSEGWKNGKPVSHTTGIPQIVKYMRLESYEDALNNIALQTTAYALNFGDEYLINYMLDAESRESFLNTDKFNEPFNFAMRITERNETKTRHIDVVETFNYLIGLRTSSKGEINIFRAVPAPDPTYDGAVVLSQDDNGDFMFQQIKGTLPDGRRALVIWRNITDNVLRSNAALDAYFQKYHINPRDREFDVIFVNGDNNLENLRLDDETWKVVMTEQEFNNRMWEEA